MANNRVYFPIQAVILYRGNDTNYDKPYSIHGAQEVSIASNFTITPTFELGQSAIYANIDGIPTVEIQVTKLIDGQPLIWHLATLDAKSPTLIGRSASFAHFQLGIWPEDSDSCFFDGTGDENGKAANGSTLPIAVITCPKVFPSNLSYQFTIDAASQEQISLSGNEKVWARGVDIADDRKFAGIKADFQNNDDTPKVKLADRASVLFTPSVAAAQYDRNGALLDPDCTILPVDIPGIRADGVNDLSDANVAQVTGPYNDPNYASVTSINVSASLAREDKTILGRYIPVFKNLTVPVNVTCEVVTTAATHDGVTVQAQMSACEAKSAGKDYTIRIAACNGDEPTNAVDGDANGIRIYLGTKNRLASANYAQGGTGGGNVQHTYSYQTSNDFTVLAKTDPNVLNWDEAANDVLVDGWWEKRIDFLCATPDAGAVVDYGFRKDVPMKQAGDVQEYNAGVTPVEPVAP